MKTITINKNDIPEWEYGDVVVKKFSFGGKLRLSEHTNTTSIKDNKVAVGEKIVNNYELGISTLCEGIHSIKDAENYEYLIRPHSHVDDKKTFFTNDDISVESGLYLLQQVKEYNNPTSEDEKKNL